jgi:hypothetical protein
MKSFIQEVYLFAEWNYSSYWGARSALKNAQSVSLKKRTVINNDAGKGVIVPLTEM